jgi:NADP-dependent 3-hydroxy acid dehydrogenase YdfG
VPDLSGKVAIVTGCASGIGAATVRRLVADGAQVLGTDISATRGAALCAEVGALFAVQDVSDRALWPQIVARAVEAFGRLDILVNNAGMVSGAGIGDLDDDAMFAAWDQVLAVNLTGTMAGCRASIAAMRANPGGSKGAIVNIASTTAIAPLPTDVGYSTSKGAVRVLSKSVATWCAQHGLDRDFGGGGTAHTGLDCGGRENLTAEPPCRPCRNSRRDCVSRQRRMPVHDRRGNAGRWRSDGDPSGVLITRRAFYPDSPSAPSAPPSMRRSPATTRRTPDTPRIPPPPANSRLALAPMHR